MDPVSGLYVIKGLRVEGEPRNRLRVGPLTAYATGRDWRAVSNLIDRIGLGGNPVAIELLDSAANPSDDLDAQEHGAALALAKRGLLTGYTCLAAWAEPTYPGAMVVRWFAPESVPGELAPPMTVAGWTPVDSRMALVGIEREEVAE